MFWTGFFAVLIIAFSLLAVAVVSKGLGGKTGAFYAFSLGLNWWLVSWSAIWLEAERPLWAGVIGGLALVLAILNLLLLGLAWEEV